MRQQQEKVIEEVKKIETEQQQQSETIAKIIDFPNEGENNNSDNDRREYNDNRSNYSYRSGGTCYGCGGGPDHIWSETCWRGRYY